MAKEKPVTKAQEKKARAIMQRVMNNARAREHEERSQLIGRCFKYPNRFSSGEPWWLYAIVTSVQDTQIIVAQFQHDTEGSLRLDCDTYGGSLPVGGWESVARDEFERAVTVFGGAFLRKLASVTTSPPAQETT